jgi:hypothetical protein
MKGVAWTKIDETGNRYSKLLVLRFSHVDASKTAFFVCLCDCGTETIVRK